MRRNKTIHIIEVFIFFMRELYFEEFISFAALLLIHERLKFLASSFHDFNDRVDREKINFCKMKCYVLMLTLLINGNHAIKVIRLPLFYNIY